MSARAFAEGLLARGIELVQRGDRLHVWPGKAYRSLTDAERAFIREHRAELKELAASHALPEAVVVWRHNGPPTPTADAPVPAPPPDCPFCQRPCVGPEHPAFRVLHWLDPQEQARRTLAASAWMFVQVGR